MICWMNSCTFSLTIPSSVSHIGLLDAPWGPAISSFFTHPLILAHRGSPIRLHLERPTSFQLTQFAVNNITGVDGEMVSREAGEVILSATWLDSVTDVGFDGEGWTLRIPESNVTALELKRVSWWRTGAAVLGGVLVTILGFDIAGTGTEGSGGGGGDVNPL